MRVGFILFACVGLPLVPGPAARTPEVPAAPKELRRFGPASQAAFSPDGRTLVSGGPGRGLRFWDAATGKLMATLRQEPGEDCAVALSPDGRTVASFESQQTTLWEVATGSRRAALPSQLVFSTAAFAPSGRLLATVEVDGRMVVWDLPSGHIKANVQAHTGEAYSVCFSPDGKTLATGGRDGKVRLWRVPEGEPVRTCAGHTDAVSSVAFSPDGRLLASASWDGTVRLWEVTSGVQRAVLKGHTGLVVGVAFAPTGRLLASAARDGTARLWDVAGRRELHSLRGHGEGVWTVAFSPDGRLLATAGSDNRIRLWDVFDCGRPARQP
jgi:WD40 repeat protein